MSLTMSNPVPSTSATQTTNKILQAVNGNQSMLWLPLTACLIYFTHLPPRLNMSILSI